MNNIGGKCGYDRVDIKHLCLLPSSKRRKTWRDKEGKTLLAVSLEVPVLLVPTRLAKNHPPLLLPNQRRHLQALLPVTVKVTKAAEAVCVVVAVVVAAVVLVPPEMLLQALNILLLAMPLLILLPMASLVVEDRAVDAEDVEEAVAAVVALALRVLLPLPLPLLSKTGRTFVTSPLFAVQPSLSIKRTQFLDINTSKFKKYSCSPIHYSF